MRRTSEDRVAWLRHIPKGGVSAEIGVHYGNYSSRIIQVTRPKLHHLIDPYVSQKLQGPLTVAPQLAHNYSYDFMLRPFTLHIIHNLLKFHNSYSNYFLTHL